MHASWLLALAALLVAFPAAAEETPVTQWIWIDSVPAPFPAFFDESGGEVELEELLAAGVGQAADWPRPGGEHIWPSGEARTWSTQNAESLDLGPVDDQSPQRALAAFTITVDRFVTVDLSIATPHLARVWVDGAQQAEKTKADSEPDGESEEETGIGTADAELDLVRGTHVVLVHTLSDPASTHAWTLAASVSVEDDVPVQVELGATDAHSLRLTDLFDVDQVSNASISADGEYVAVQYRNPVANADHVDRWVEISDRRGELVRSFAGMGNLSGFAWGPEAAASTFSFVTRADGEATVWVGDLQDGSIRSVVDGVADFGTYRWMPDAASLLYTVTEDAKPAHDEAKRYQGLPDRWSGFRDKSYLYQASVADGSTRRLTAGILSTSLSDVAPDGGSIVFSRRVDTYGEWPYVGTELYELDLASLQAEMLHQFAWSAGVDYSPDGRYLLITGSPTAFGDLGTNVPEGQIPNLYDTQLYLMDRESGDVDAITRDFDPKVDGAEWSGASSLVVRAQVGSRTKLFQYRLKDRRFQELETMVDVTDGMDVAANGKRLVYRGTSPNQPRRVYIADAKPGASSRLIADPSEAWWADIETGTVDDFDVNVDGKTLQGRVYLPPGFDRAATYPAIVYYYGGTSPVSRSYGGRYPKELWAAMGYVVYVLQPSGATGYGQAFSAEHVNNWGKTVTGQIIAGTEAFLAAHPFVDPKRVGCIGASYGGFMTMLITTQTDMFGAAVSHAGISSISSYWGEGWWGYLYSAGATAKAYPWNRPDVYIDQSALFHADEIDTPLLLLHGAIDNNVPPGESEQLYTALKVLDKDVEYILIDGERHWILDYDRRTLWTNSILAYFDWKLKDESAWWDSLWGD